MLAFCVIFFSLNFVSTVCLGPSLPPFEFNSFHGVHFTAYCVYCILVSFLFCISFLLFWRYVLFFVVHCFFSFLCTIGIIVCTQFLRVFLFPFRKYIRSSRIKNGRENDQQKIVPLLLDINGSYPVPGNQGSFFHKREQNQMSLLYSKALLKSEIRGKVMLSVN